MAFQNVANDETASVTKSLAYCNNIIAKYVKEHVKEHAKCSKAISGITRGLLASLEPLSSEVCLQLSILLAT